MSRRPPDRTAVLIFVTTPEHAYTHARLAVERDAVRVEVASWDEVLAERASAHATYILTDCDRLPAWRVRQAALYWRRLKADGRRVLNNPALMTSRQGLLRRLHRAGINGFDAYRVEEGVLPKRWPVFLRTDGDHDRPLTGLLENAAELRRAVRQALSKGFPITSLLIIEFAAEPVRPGLYRKLSVFRLGDRMLGYTNVHETNWVVKYGQPGVAPLDLYEEEFEAIRDDRYGDALRGAFDMAGVEYGRADFGLVDGRPQIYEINTNPDVNLRPEPSPIARRNESYALFRDKYLAALQAADTSDGSGA